MQTKINAAIFRAQIFERQYFSKQSFAINLNKKYCSPKLKNLYRRVIIGIIADDYLWNNKQKLMPGLNTT